MHQNQVYQSHKMVVISVLPCQTRLSAEYAQTPDDLESGMSAQGVRHAAAARLIDSGCFLIAVVELQMCLP
jgi:hypothetical protein